MNYKSRVCMLLLPLLAGSALGAEPVELHWLADARPAVEQGVAFGVPWPKGEQQPNASFELRTEDGTALSTASWPMAYWPDGSLKWSGHAMLATQGLSKKLLISAVEGGAEVAPMVTPAGDGAIRIDTGALNCVIEKSGDVLFRSLEINGTVVGKNLMPVGYVQDKPSGEVLAVTTKELSGRILSVKGEQQNAVRTVVKVDGEYVAGASKDGIVPFSARLYFYKGSPSIRMVYTIRYEGDERKDYIRGLGLKMEVPMEGDLLNRHVLFAGEGRGVWHEPSRLYSARPGRLGRSDMMFRSQLNGQELDLGEAYGQNRGAILNDLAAWDGFKLVQLSSKGFEVLKRTGAHSSWRKSDGGARARGQVFAGTTKGGIVWGLRDFWQSYPSSIEVNGMTTDAADVVFWLWPPEAEAMDLRHYDVKAHGLQASYEDHQEGIDKPFGVSRTFEMTIRGTEAVPSNDAFSAMADATAAPALLVCSPEYYHSIPAFGRWSLPDTSSPSLQWVEDRLARLLDYLIGEVDRRDWYGFWDYGDVMHQYDPVRHQWRYDVGGFAWANTELAPNVWLWTSFLRTGDADVFRIAESMARHTSEVDMYHSGPLKGLGSRHNVSHWGGGAKEVRISQALFHRPYYYLTADERIGDVMMSVADNEQALLRLNPLRKVAEKSDWPTQARVGPDWFALAGDWYTAWERTGDDKYLEQIKTGMDSILALPYGLFTGPYLNYNPRTGKFGLVNDQATFQSTHMAAIFGGGELMLELVDQVDHPGWTQAWLEYCERYNWGKEDWIANGLAPIQKTGGFAPWHSRLSAYAGMINGDESLKQRAWRELLRTPGEPLPPVPYPVDDTSVLHPVVENPTASINQMSQWSLNAIEVLEFAADAIPEEMPPDRRR